MQEPVPQRGRGVSASCSGRSSTSRRSCSRPSSAGAGRARRLRRPHASLALVWFLRRETPERPPPTPAPRQQSADDERRILVVANETVGGRELREAIRERREGDASERARRVARRSNSPLRHWASDEDGGPRRGAGAARPQPRGAARALGYQRARARSATPTRCRRSRTRCGPSARTRSSSRRIPRAGRTGSSAASSTRARERFAVPITHVVVDLDRESEEVR